MKKKLLVFLAILILSLCLVGCGRIMFDQYANPTESPNHKTDALAYDVDYCAEEGTSTETHTSHVYTTRVVEATCETRGYTLHSCVGCDKSYKTDHVAAKGHEYEKEDVKATCTTGSYTLYSCKNCDKSYKENFQPAVGHQYAEEKTAPTCTTRGYTTYTCTECGTNTRTQTDTTMRNQRLRQPARPEDTCCTIAKIVKRPTKRNTPTQSPTAT